LRPQHHGRDVRWLFDGSAARAVVKPVTRNDVAAKTVPELKRMLRERLLKTTGNKAALIDRLVDETVTSLSGSTSAVRT
jgi:hypothetical protein